jgi:hypothetical protein
MATKPFAPNLLPARPRATGALQKALLAQLTPDPPPDGKKKTSPKPPPKGKLAQALLALKGAM